MSEPSQPGEDFELDDRCVVPWKDGSIYAGKVQRILDPKREAIIQGVVTRKAGKAVLNEESTPFEKLKNERNQRVSQKIIQESVLTGDKWYYVHYFGWKPNYDEWLPPSRMLPYTPKNVNEMKRVNAELKEREKLAKLKKDEAKAKKPQLGKKRTDSPAASVKAEPAHSRSSESVSAKAAGTRAKRGRGETSVNGAAAGVDVSPLSEIQPGSERGKRRRVVLDDGPGIEIKLVIPLRLKRLLVRDWELVTKQREIVQLPRPISVATILRDYVEAEATDSDGYRENLDHFVTSMTTYFNYAFGMMLLYRFERNQYYAVRHGARAPFHPSTVYGAEHLARLLVSMPALLSQMSHMDDKTMEFVVEQVNKLANFLSDHSQRYFAGEKTYDTATRFYEACSVPNMAGESAPSEANIGVAKTPSEEVDAAMQSTI